MNEDKYNKKKYENKDDKVSRYSIHNNKRLSFSFLFDCRCETK